MNRICIVIPQYNHSEMTRRCVELCRKNAGVEHEILVVDDGSEDQYLYEDHYVLPIKENSGFTNAANEGILWAQRAGYDYVHLLNNDTEPEPDFLKHLLDLMEENPVVGIAGSARILETNTPHNIELYGADLIRGYQVCTDGNIEEEVIYTHWVPLCSALIRMDMIRYIGLLDRRMKIWCSDNFYCLKANANGWNVAVVLKSRVKHFHAVTTNDVQKERKYTPEHDQKILIQELAGMYFADLMTKLPLDAEQGVWGKIEFTTYKKGGAL